MPSPTILSLIASVARNGGIGRGNELVWRESADQKFFRAVTMGHPVIMGRRTWDSLPERFRPLPGRRNIVVTRDAAWQPVGAEAAGSLEAALGLVAGSPKAYVIGGAQLYAQALPHADELVLTEIDADFDADTWFPAWNRADFELAAHEDHVTAGGVPYRFATWRRRRG
jgi:dihydrofolate reductase